MSWLYHVTQYINVQVCGELLSKHKLVENASTVNIQARGGSVSIKMSNSKSVCMDNVSWYDMVFTPRRASAAIAAHLTVEDNHADFHKEFLSTMNNLMSALRSGEQVCLISKSLGRGMV